TAERVCVCVCVLSSDVCVCPGSSHRAACAAGKTAVLRLHVCLRLRSDNKVTVHFINRDGEKIAAKGSPGDSLLDVVINEDLDFDGFGACEGTLACSTCHLIFDDEVYKKLGPVTDEEMDMLDLAYGLTETTRGKRQQTLKVKMTSGTAEFLKDSFTLSLSSRLSSVFLSSRLSLVFLSSRLSPVFL
uniref:2Fe-2S ferredoxin-type domain-containing protein n=1 Tax=Kryptolebias marmoratus TaxID=37003 RepID=A0A3Q3ABE8_KRYMA